MDTFKTFCPRVQKLLKLVPAGNVLEWRLRVHLPLKTWVDGNVCLTGDAAHSTLPHLAQGAAQAAEDAAVLAVVMSKIAKKEDIHKALKVYEVGPFSCDAVSTPELLINLCSNRLCENLEPSMLLLRLRPMEKAFNCLEELIAKLVTKSSRKQTPRVGQTPISKLTSKASNHVNVSRPSMLIICCAMNRDLQKFLYGVDIAAETERKFDEIFGGL